MEHKCCSENLKLLSGELSITNSTKSKLVTKGVFDQTSKRSRDVFVTFSKKEKRKEFSELLH